MTNKNCKKKLIYIFKIVHNRHAKLFLSNNFSETFIFCYMKWILLNEEFLWMRILGRISEISRMITKLYQTLISLCFVSSNLMKTVSIFKINMHLFQLFKMLVKNVVNQIRTYLTGQYIISVNRMTVRVCRPHFIFFISTKRFRYDQRNCEMHIRQESTILAKMYN